MTTGPAISRWISTTSWNGSATSAPERSSAWRRLASYSGGVTDLRIDVDWGSPGSQTALHPLSIDRVEREPIRDQKVYLDRPYYTWTIVLNWPASSRIAFGAVGFTQTQRAEPVLTDKQSLSLEERRRLKP